MSKSNQGLTSSGKLLAVAIFVGVGYLIGITSRDATVQADLRRSPAQPQHFQSGAQRSEVLLQQIAKTLGTMDGRLDRIERLAAQIAAQNGQPAAEENR